MAETPITVDAVERMETKRAETVQALQRTVHDLAQWDAIDAADRTRGRRMLPPLQSRAELQAAQESLAGQLNVQDEAILRAVERLRERERDERLKG